MILLATMILTAKLTTGPTGLDRLLIFNRGGQIQGRSLDMNDPLLLIQVVNDLVPLGTREAMRRLDKFSRSSDGFGVNFYLFWVARILFKGKKPGYFFPYPQIGGISPLPPKDLSTWPTYPLVENNDIPFNLVQIITGAGHPQAFLCDKKSWTIRTQKLVPPDDPFPFDKKPVNVHVTYSNEEYTTQARMEIIGLVRTAYQISRSRVEDIGSDRDFEIAHQDFLKLGCHWDRFQNMYVRGDGTFDLDVL